MRHESKYGADIHQQYMERADRAYELADRIDSYVPPAPIVPAEEADLPSFQDEDFDTGGEG